MMYGSDGNWLIACFWIYASKLDTGLSRPVVTTPGRTVSVVSRPLPEQDSGVSEGDILDLDLAALLREATGGSTSHDHQNRQKRNVVIFSYFRWPDRLIPYTLDILYNGTEQKHITEAMEEFHSKTCIKFVPRDRQTDYLSIIKYRGCASKIGRQGGRQPLYLNEECIDSKRPGIIMHELMHSLGFLHEQTRHDRDNFIDVLWDNIAPNHQDNFAKVDRRLVDLYTVAYDYGSVMHYGPNFFAVNYTNPTIVPKKPTAILGQRKQLSEMDALKINNLYCENDKEIT